MIRNATEAFRRDRATNSLNGFAVRAGVWMIACVCGSTLARPDAIAQEKTPARSTADVEDVDTEQLFVRRIAPLLREKCLGCHGQDPEDVQGGLDLSGRSALSGGDSQEPLVRPEDLEDSPLWLAVTRADSEWSPMPPKEAERLTEQQLDWIRQWLAAGAAWPTAERQQEISTLFADSWSAADGVQVSTSGGLSEDWTNRRYQPEHLWAYRPLQNDDVPTDEVPADAHPVDHFLHRRLAELQLPAAPDASAVELARRMSFGLTGLPPRPSAVTEFSAQFELSPKKAVQTYADQLMSSPAYGEHFGRHWLDVVRYADSAGFANDYARPNAWRYRDYVVRAFNQDKPYDQFVREQIAGDELPDASAEQIIATGFLRMGPWEQTAMSVFRVTRQQWLDDVTDAVGQTFMAHPLQCAKCHDHKFDPVPTRDYYSLQAVFSTTQFAEPDVPFLSEENRFGFEWANQWTAAKIKAYRDQLKELNKQMAANRQQETGDAKIGDNGLSPGDEASQARMNKNVARHTWELDKTQPIALAVYTGATIQRNNVSKRLQAPAAPWKGGELDSDAIRVGGDVFTLGESVTPAPLSAADQLGDVQYEPFPDGRGKRRLALANWLTHPRNPLTARVIANRVWSWHFGQGLAGNPNNFGATGSLPSHPRLLDYLARWLIRHDWSIKALNELIVTSQAYRRSSRHPQPELLAELDPEGRSYATFQPRRLTAEELRDAMLWTSGELNRQVGGIPCRPAMNSEVALQPRQIMGGTASVYEPDPLPHQRNRRSLYAERNRGLRDPFFETFNQPGPDKSCELRETSTVAPQALTLMNSADTKHRALAFAARLLDETNGSRQALLRAFRLALGRPPSGAEVRACQRHWESATQAEQAMEPERDSFPDRIERTVMAEKTGEPYDFWEVLPSYSQYVPDVEAADLDARTRGLARVCLVLFNSNEFSYLD